MRSNPPCPDCRGPLKLVATFFRMATRRAYFSCGPCGTTHMAFARRYHDAEDSLSSIDHGEFFFACPPLAERELKAA